MAALGEFALIARYFAREAGERQGVGDDCALIDVGERTLALTSDMLLEGVHFLSGADPQSLGHKCLAVNLSDLAAAGARPRCFLLDLCLPVADPDWLEAFSHGLFALADEHACALIGGDTIRAAPVQSAPGPLTVAITAIGEVDRNSYCGRSGARAGDDIWVSGRLGEAALALALRRGQVELASPYREQCLQRMDRPSPRVALGLALAGVATASIDISDGLLGDLGHILERSGVGAQIRWDDVPRSEVFGQFSVALQQKCVLAGGDDYELLFTASPAARGFLEAMVAVGSALTRIGRVRAEQGLLLLDGDGAQIAATLASFDHFASGS